MVDGRWSGMDDSGCPSSPMDTGKIHIWNLMVCTGANALGQLWLNDITAATAFIGTAIGEGQSRSQRRVNATHLQTDDNKLYSLSHYVCTVQM